MCCTADPLPPLVFRFNCNVERASNLLVIQLLQLEFNCNVERTSTILVIRLLQLEPYFSDVITHWSLVQIKNDPIWFLIIKLKCVPLCSVKKINWKNRENTSYYASLLLSFSSLHILLGFYFPSTFYWHCSPLSSEFNILLRLLASGLPLLDYAATQSGRVVDAN